MRYAIRAIRPVARSKGPGLSTDRMEPAVTAARIAASAGKGAIFAPLAMGGAGGLRSGGPPNERLEHVANLLIQDSQGEWFVIP